MIIILEYGASSVFELRYHMVLVTKYRKEIFNDEIFAAINKNINIIAENHFVTIEMVNIDKNKRDHIHVVFRARPTTTLSKFVQGFKRSSAMMIFRDFPEIKQDLWNGTVWSPSYFVTSMADISRDVIEDYVATQGMPDRSRNEHGQFNGSNKKY